MFNSLLKRLIELLIIAAGHLAHLDLDECDLTSSYTRLRR
jgi:hypothetical protein